MNRAPLALVAASLLLAGCAGPEYTVRQLGHPEFERYVGADTRFQRPDERQVKGLDAYPDTLDSSADHGFFITIWPTGDAERVWVGIEVQPRGELGLKQLVAALYPVTAQEAATFEGRGALPPGAEPLLVADQPIRGGRGLAVKLLFERSKLPPGKDYLAIPTLTQFEDGWIHIRFYKTKVPATPEELQRHSQGGSQGEAKPGRPAAPAPGAGTPPPPEAPPPEAPPPVAPPPEAPPPEGPRDPAGAPGD